MPIEELAHILVQMCDNAEQYREKSVMLHLFGIRYVIKSETDMLRL